jgi:hypothetical protein
MPDPENPCCPKSPEECSSELITPSLPAGMTLESLIDLTGEMEHLNELVMLNLDRGGGFTCTAAYFSTVQPILDLLEVEIRVRYRAGMTKEDMRQIIQDWIDEEISLLQ